MAVVRLDCFLLCQEVSQSVGSPLLNLQGLIPGPVTIDFSKAPPFGAPLAFPSLWAIAIFSGMSGIRDLELSWELRPPGDQGVLILPKQKVTREQPDETHTIANRYAPFMIPTAGKYTFTVTLTIEDETRSFSRTLDVRAGTAPQPGRVQ